MAAWGKPDGAVPAFYNERITEVLEIIDRQKIKFLYCLGFRKEGYPYHPSRAGVSKMLKKRKIETFSN
jgi:hypothetical protein